MQLMLNLSLRFGTEMYGPVSACLYCAFSFAILSSSEDLVDVDAHLLFRILCHCIRPNPISSLSTRCTMSCYGSIETQLGVSSGRAGQSNGFWVCLRCTKCGLSLHPVKRVHRIACLRSDTVWNHESTQTSNTLTCRPHHERLCSYWKAEVGWIHVVQLCERPCVVGTSH